MFNVQSVTAATIAPFRLVVPDGALRPGGVSLVIISFIDLKGIFGEYIRVRRSQLVR